MTQILKCLTTEKILIKIDNYAGKLANFFRKCESFQFTLIS